MPKLRLHKYIAQCGIASRRKAENLIQQGKVEVNGRLVTAMGVMIDPDNAVVCVDGKKIKQHRDHVYYLFHKPRGVVTTLHDPEGRRTVADYFKKLPRRVFPVGRLDYHSEGLLLVTDDGAWAQEIQHPSHRLEKVYHVKIKGDPTPATFARLRKGVYLADGRARALHVRVISTLKHASWIEIVVAEGRNHLVRRMCAEVGYPVRRLRRVQVGPYTLGKLKVGEFITVTKKNM